MRKKEVIIILLIISIFQVSALDVCQNKVSTNELEIESITDTRLDGQTAWSWKTGSEVRVEVRVENKNYSQRDFEIELLFYDENENSIENFAKNGNPTKIINLNQGETKSENLTFEVSEITNGKYLVYAKVTDENDENTCTDMRAGSNATIRTEVRWIEIKNITGPTKTMPGSYIEYTIKIENQGDVKEPKILTTVRNLELGIKWGKETLNLDKSKSVTLKFNFTIPENTTLSNYSISFLTQYNYDNDTGRYLEAFQDGERLTLEITENTTDHQVEAPIINQNQSPQTTNQTISPTTNNKSSNSSITEMPYFWITIATTPIIIIIIVIFFYLKKREERIERNNRTFSSENHEPSEKVNEYLKNLKSEN